MINSIHPKQSRVLVHIVMMRKVLKHVWLVTSVSIHVVIQDIALGLLRELQVAYLRQNVSFLTENEKLE